METKQCQMIKAQSYLLALKQCAISETIDISLEDLKREHIIENDLERSCFISQAEEDFNAIWLKNYKSEKGNQYYQGRIEGNVIPSTKMTSLRMLFSRFGLINISADVIGFSFRDDNKRLCGFTITALLNYPSIWFASLTINTEAPEDKRQITVFIPEFSKKMFKPSMAKEVEARLYEDMSKLMKIDDALLFPMNSLSEQLGLVLNSEFIRYFLTGLFDSKGAIFPDQFRVLQKAIKNKASMFDFSKEEKTSLKSEPFTLEEALSLIKSNHAWAMKNYEVVKAYLEFAEEELTEDIQEENKKALDEADFVLDFNEEIKKAVENLVTEHPDREQMLGRFLRAIKEIKTKEALLSALTEVILDLLQHNTQCTLGEDLVKVKNLLTPIDDASTAIIKKEDNYSKYELKSDSFTRPKTILSLEELRPYYSPRPLSAPEGAFFKGTLFFNKTMSYFNSNEESELSTWNAYDEVLHRIYLGRIPEFWSNPLPKDVGLVVSVITYGELAGVYFPFEEFCAQGIRHIFIYMEDFTANVSNGAQINAMSEMERFLQESDKKIYIHCKAGASRSASFLATFHSFINDVPLLSAIEFVNSKRNQVYVGGAKQAKALEIITLAKTKAKKPDEGGVSHCLASLEAKTMLCQLPSFKALALYVARSYANSKRALCLVNFFTKMLVSKEATWFLTLEDKESELMQFIASQPQLTEDDKPLRKQLVGEFIKEVKELEIFLSPFYEKTLGFVALGS